MFKELQKFIAKIRDSEEAVRRRYFIVLSAISMAAVIGLWIVYLNAVINPVESGFTEQDAAGGPGFFRIFGAGIGAIAGELRTGAASAMSFLREKGAAANFINLNRSEINFAVDDLEPIPKTALP